MEAHYPDSSNELTVVVVAAPLGKMLTVLGDKGLCLLEFVGQKQPGQEITAVQKALYEQSVFQENEQTQLLHQELDSCFQSRLKVFTTPLETIGTALQRQMRNALLTIPCGEVRNHKGQAQQLDNPKAIHAVAATDGQNKVSILVPYHRVIGSDDKLTGYAGGLNHRRSSPALEQDEVQMALS